jgi:hypothetical protein
MKRRRAAIWGWHLQPEGGCPAHPLKATNVVAPEVALFDDASTLGRGEGPIPRELDRSSPADREAPRGRERLRARLLVREDDTFPAKSPGAGLGRRGGRAVEQRS